MGKKMRKIKALYEESFESEEFAEKINRDTLEWDEENPQIILGKKSKPIDKKYAISINDYMREYLYPTFCLNATRLTHDELKGFPCAYILRVSNDFGQENKVYLKNKFLLVVLDAKKNPVTYVNPLVLKEYVDDVVSGISDPNPAFYRMLEECERNHKVDRIINDYQKYCSDINDTNTIVKKI